MSSSSSQQETCLGAAVAAAAAAAESTEIDSEGSSGGGGGEERQSHRHHRRLPSAGELDGLLLLLPKKRRKQSTPVKFSTTSLSPCTSPASPASPADNDNECEDADSGAEDDAMTTMSDEGKPTTPVSPTSSTDNRCPKRAPPTLKDENLNNEFRCQVCGQIFDSRSLLELHLLECEHHNVFAPPLPPPPHNPPLHPPPHHHQQQQQSSPTEQPNSPVNLSGLSIRNFATNAWSQEQNAARSNNHFAAMTPFPPTHLAQFLPIAGFPVGPQAAMQIAHGQLQAAAAAAPKIFNLDAYCELCNKEFCNKYFLKTHKANKHGVYSDPPQPSSSPLVQTTSPVDSSQLHQINQLAVACDLCSKRFKNEDSLRKHRSKVHFGPNVDVAVAADASGEEERQSPGGMESLFKQEISIDHDEAEAASYRCESSTPIRGSALAVSPPCAPLLNGNNGDRLGRIGVMNPEAFCELCCKEYCNKYFLRTHKLKRHGIFISDDKSTCAIQAAAAAAAAAATTSWHQVQTSPLNLMVADHPSLGNGSADAAAAETSDERVDECSSCKSCGIRFQTHQLYNLHMERIHDKLKPGSGPNKAKQEAEASERASESISISEDLQKLQTMILQLNGLESNKAASCALCGRDYDSPDALRSHMVAEHRVVPDNLAAAAAAAASLSRDKSSPNGGGGSRSRSRSCSSNGSGCQQAAAAAAAVCPLCERECASQEALRKHVAEEHQPSTPKASAAPPPPHPPQPPPQPPQQQQQQPERKPTVNVTPTSSYCEICNKELCNKYFMKTHMQKMHGIEIENGAQIGGVVCNICKKELCSKYFLRVHKQNTHGIVEEGSSPSTHSTSSSASSKQQQQQQHATDEAPGLLQPDDLALRPEQLGDVNLRYIIHFTEVCPICNRRFRSPKWLKAHLQAEHGEAGQIKWREIEQYNSNNSQSSQMPRAPVPARSPKQQQQQQQQLRIPNGFEAATSAPQQIRPDLAALNNQVLSNFFAGSADDQQPAQAAYRCSQPMCNFSTPILALFFLHERSHNQQQQQQQQQQQESESERAIQCPVCSQSFSQLEHLRQHVASRHPSPFPGLLSQFPIPLLNDFGLLNEQQQQQRQQERNDYPEEVRKEDVRQASPHHHHHQQQQQHQRHPHHHVQMKSSEIKQEDACSSSSGSNNAVQVMPQGAYKCFQCAFTTANLNRIKKHIKKDHKSLGGDPQEAALAELSKTLKDVANKHKVPASYAMPQDSTSQLGQGGGAGAGASSSDDKLIMQPFIIEEQITKANNGCDSSSDCSASSSRRFAPALVFLPVKARLAAALSITFSLNPA